MVEKETREGLFRRAIGLRPEPYRIWEPAKYPAPHYDLGEKRLRYRLIVLTHGNMETLYPTLQSFAKNVDVPPCDVWIHADGCWPMKKEEETVWSTDPVVCGKRYRLTSGPHLNGFCGSMRRCWNEAMINDVQADYVFWLEHDFIFGREFKIELLRAPLDADPKLAQMALMRNAVNEEEKAAGGLYQLRRNDYERRSMISKRKEWDPESRKMVQLKAQWLEHRSYFTTNPSLMTVEFMRENPWPEHRAQCEGRYGLGLIEKGYKFGAYGRGEAWVGHIGERTGTGY